MVYQFHVSIRTKPCCVSPTIFLMFFHYVFGSCTRAGLIFSLYNVCFSFRISETILLRNNLDSAVLSCWYDLSVLEIHLLNSTWKKQSSSHTRNVFTGKTISIIPDVTLKRHLLVIYARRTIYSWRFALFRWLEFWSLINNTMVWTAEGQAPLLSHRVNKLYFKLDQVPLYLLLVALMLQLAMVS